ncbi:MAG: glucoamylase family protein, partial [Clostridia bacterium]
MKVNLCVSYEAECCFKYFYDNFSRQEQSYGLMRDKYPKNDKCCSISATGFMLASMVAGEQLGYIGKEEARNICEKTLSTLLTLPESHGFFYHFYDKDNCQRLYKCELSTIDTALLIAGAITAGQHFGLQDKADKVFDRIDWNYFVDKDKQMFYMARYDNGFCGYWDVYAEQLILYILACGAKEENRIDKNIYYSFQRLVGTYDKYEYIYSWFGSIFTYQFSHAFVSFKGLVDEDGTDWFNNSVIASLSARQYCIDNASNHAGYGANSWGLTSCVTPNDYQGRIGCIPSGNGNIENISDGTVAPCGAIGSIIFTPKESISAMEHYSHIDRLNGEYGFFDSYNADFNWVCDEYISIDKGISLIMIA